MSDVTRILQSINSGDPKAGEELLPLVYEELRRLAAAKMAREKPGQTLQPTALVHEVWLRLVGQNDRDSWKNQAHFFAAAAEAMRRILIDIVRRKKAERHGGNLQRVDMEEARMISSDKEDHILAINEAIDSLADEDPHKAELVKLRYFGGLSFEEAASLLNISVPTAKRHWAYARAWLHDNMTQDEGP